MSCRWNEEEETCEFDGAVCLRETDAALLCRVEGQELWFPKSQLVKDSEVRGGGDKGVLVVTRWIAEKKGLV